MKKSHILTPLLFLAASLSAQDLDVTQYSQNIALADSMASTKPVVRQPAPYPTVSELYEIPAYGLYQQYWDTNNLRSKMLEIPFSNDRLMLMLIQDANNPFVIPCQFDKVRLAYGTTKKGEFHTGIDLKTERQTLVKSCFDGVVRMATYYGDYGQTVVVRHYNGLETVYAHLDKLCVKPNQIVKAGQVIGQTGTTGNSKECVLHFETRFMNEYFDPELVIDFEEEELVQNNMALMSHDFNILPLNEVGNWKPTVPKPKAAAPEIKSVPTQDARQESKSPATTGLDPNSQSPEMDNQSVSNKSPNTNVDSSEAIYHTVSAGENLYRISLKYGTTVDKILKINNLKDADKIKEGQRLRVR